VLAFRAPAAIIAVFAAATILACASSSAALFLSSAAAEALHRIAAADCPDATYPTVTIDSISKSTPADDDAVRAAMAGAGLPAPYRVMQAQDTLFGRSRGVPATFFYRPAAADNVTVLARGPARGVWLPEILAKQLGLRPGQRVGVGAARTGFPVAGIYRDLWREPVRPYWCSYTSLYAGTGTQPFTLVTDPETFTAMQQAGGGGIEASWTAPVDPAALALSDARELAGRQAAAYRTLGTGPPVDFASRNSGPGQLPAFADQAALVRDGLRGPVVPIALGGTILALLLVGAAGSYWADRRAGEVRLLSSRGVSPAALAGKAVLELAAPAVAGTILGWLLARWLVAALGPSPRLDRSAPVDAALTAAVALAAGLALLALVAGLRSRAATERPVGGRRSRLAATPWELALLAGAAVCYLRLRAGGGVVLVQGVAQVNLLVVAFPLLFLVGSALLVMRLLATLLPAAGRLAGRRSAAWYLAIRRVTAARVVSVTLLAAASTPMAVLVYAAGLTQTSQYTLDAKARLFVGSEVDVETLEPLRRTPETDQVGTIVNRYIAAKIGGADVAVLAIDPDTFTGPVYWDARYADLPLAALIDRIRQPAAGGRVPAVLVPAGDLTLAGVGARYDIPLGTTTAKLTVAATSRLFPGRRLPVPMLVVDTHRLGPVDPHAGSRNELWSRHDRTAVEAAVTGQGARVFDVADRASVFAVANYLGISWTFGYLTALAALVGLVAVGGLLLYLETRQRSRVAAYAVGRRMGLSRATHLRSLLAELGTLLLTAFLVGTTLAWAAILLVYHRLDVDTSRPPAPLLTMPTTAILGAAVGVLAVTVLAALYAQRAADRTNVTDVLRLGG
jgi:putative ABC transport system permease protein